MTPRYIERALTLTFTPSSPTSINIAIGRKKLHGTVDSPFRAGRHFHIPELLLRLHLGPIGTCFRLRTHDTHINGITVLSPPSSFFPVFAPPAEIKHTYLCLSEKHFIIYNNLLKNNRYAIVSLYTIYSFSHIIPQNMVNDLLNQL